MLNPSDLADALNTAIDAKDKDGLPISTTPEMIAYATAICNTLLAGIVNHAIPGSVSGTTAAGAPLAAGAATGGLVSALLPSIWQGVMSSAIPTADPAALATDATQSTTYLMAASLVEFASGGITGTCTSTPVSPGPLALGAGTNGEISGIAGSSWSALVLPPLGDPSLASAIYDAITNYIKDNASVTYLPGTVQGVCPPASGPLSAGLAAGGTIS